jgi:hypothetical protein
MPPELKWRVPSPAVVLIGDSPFTPGPPGPCRVCGGHVRDIRSTIPGEPDAVVVCGHCDRMEDHWEDLLARQRAETRFAEDAATRAARDREWVESAAGSIGPDDVLAEVDRRRIFLGYASPGQGSLRFANAASAGRDFLARIGQLPDWSLLLDSMGHVVGQVVDYPSGYYELTAAPSESDNEDVWNLAPWT